MQEQEYKAKDKTTKKMSRDGLLEKNLHSRETIRVSKWELDSLTSSRETDISGNGALEGSVKPEELGKRKRPERFRDTDGVNDKNEDIVSESRPEGLSEHSSRMSSVRKSSTSSKHFAQAAAEVRHTRKKRQVREYAGKEKAKNQDADGAKGRTSEEGFDRAKSNTSEQKRDELKKKRKRAQLNKEIGRAHV